MQVAIEEIAADGLVERLRPSFNRVRGANDADADRLNDCACVSIEVEHHGITVPDGRWLSRSGVADHGLSCQKDRQTKKRVQVHVRRS